MKNSIEFNLTPGGSDFAEIGEKGGSFLKSHGLSDDSVQRQIMVIKELVKSGVTFRNQEFTKNQNQNGHPDPEHHSGKTGRKAVDHVSLVLGEVTCPDGRIGAYGKVDPENSQQEKPESGHPSTCGIK